MLCALRRRGGPAALTGHRAYTSRSTADQGHLPPNPRQIHAFLDSYVISQTPAKKILSVAVHNHQLRIKAVLRARQEAEQQAAFEEREEQRRQQEAEKTREAALEASLGLPVSPRHTNVAPGRRRVTSEAIDASVLLDEDGHKRDRRRTHPPSPSTSATSGRRPGDHVEDLFSPSYVPSRSGRQRFRPDDPDTIDPPMAKLFRERLAIFNEADKHPSAAPRRNQGSEGSQGSSAVGSEEVPTDFIGQEGTEQEASRGSASHLKLTLDIEEGIFGKSNILLLGPTGSGKSLLARTLARLLDVPYSESCATSMTQAGYVGEDVETAVTRLLQEAGGDPDLASRGVIFIDEIDKIARRPGDASFTKDVSGEGVQQALLRMLEGCIVTVSGESATGTGSAGGSSGSGLGRKGTKAGLPGYQPGKCSESVQVDTTNSAFVGLDKVVQDRVAKGSIGFNARLPPSHTSPSNPPSLPFFSSHLTPSDSTSPDLLDLVEPSDLSSYGLIPEFIGRLPIVASLKQLTENDLLRVLTEPKNALVRQYENLFEMSGVELRFTTPALKEVARKAIGKGTGARGLRRIMESLLLDSMYTAPQSSIRYILIDQAVARGDKPAVFYSRGQKHIFHSDFAADEGVTEDSQDEDDDLTTFSTLATEPDGRNNSHDTPLRRAAVA